MMLTPISASPVESVATVISVPRSVAVASTDDDANHGRRNKENRARWRRWWRHVIVSGRGRAVLINDFGSRIRPQSGSKAECEYRQCYHDKFLPHNQCYSCCWRIEPNNQCQVAKEFRSPLAFFLFTSYFCLSMPDIAKPMACSSAASKFACSVVSSISGGRTRVHAGSFR